MADAGLHGQPRLAGVVVPHDMALDGELWRWAPPGVWLLFCRTAFSPGLVTAELARDLADPELVASAACGLAAVRPAAVAYACTSGSFARGAQGERAIVAAAGAAAGAPALTTSGALLAALAALDVRRVAVATPYDDGVGSLLEAYLAEAGVGVVGRAHLGRHEQIWTVPLPTTADLVRRADHADAQAVVVSCTNLATFDLVADLEAELGKPVLTANQVTMWALMAAVGRAAVGVGQSLLDRAGQPPRQAAGRRSTAQLEEHFG